MPKPRLLVIEDDSALIEVLTFNLKKAGYDVSVARDGQSGLTLAQANPFDLIVLDLMLPVVGGKEVLARMKASEDLRSIPVLVLTSKSRKTDVDEILALGADDYVIKPFDPADLASRVRNLIHSA